MGNSIHEECRIDDIYVLQLKLCDYAISQECMSCDHTCTFDIGIMT